MKNNLILMIIFLGLIASCNKESLSDKKPKVNLSNLTTLSIDNAREIDYIKWSEVADSLNLSSMKTSDQFFIGKIKNFLVDEVNNRMFISDSQDRLSIFDLNGLWVSTIIQQGQGPTEYLDIAAVDYDSENKQIVIFDQKRKALLYYDYKGNFIKKKQYDFYTSNSFAYIGNEKVAFCLDNEPVIHGVDDNVIVVGKNGEMVKSFLPFDGVKDHTWNNFTRSGSYISYTQGVNDTIFGFTDSDILNAKYFVDFGTDDLPNDIIVKQTSRLFDGGDLSEYAHSVSSVFESDTHLSFKYVIGSTFRDCFYTKSNGEIRCGGFFDDLGLGISKSYIQLGGNKVYAIMLPELLYDRYASFKTDKNDEEIDSIYNGYGLNRNIIEQIKPDSNPFLVTIHLK